MIEGTELTNVKQWVTSNISNKFFKTQNLPMQNSYCDHRNFECEPAGFTPRTFLWSQWLQFYKSNIWTRNRDHSEVRLSQKGVAMFLAIAYRRRQEIVTSVWSLFCGMDMDVKCLRPISTQGNFSGKKNFQNVTGRHKSSVGKNVEVENFQLLTMTFSEHFLSVEIFLEWKWIFRLERDKQHEYTILIPRALLPHSALGTRMIPHTIISCIFFRLLNRFLRRKRVWLYWVKVTRYRILMNYYNVRSNFTWILSAWRKVVYEKFVK
jgi:hypothetical protein